MNMQWIVSAAEDSATGIVETRRWDVAGQFRANSGLKNREYFASVPGRTQYSKRAEASMQSIQPLDFQSLHLYQ